MNTSTISASTAHGAAGATDRRRVTIIGAGNMGRAIANGMRQAGENDQLAIADRRHDAAAALALQVDGIAISENADACRDADVILLCVKPADVIPLMTQLAARDVLNPSTLLISIAAGVRIRTIEAAAPRGMPVIRAMPNTPCLIGKGATVIAGGAHATEKQLACATTIFANLGLCLTLEERHFDAVTALSASGPAFMYVMLEALADGGVSCGLPRATATELAAQMTLGASEMAIASHRQHQHTAALKDSVATPGGCTIAGLLALEDGKFRSVVARAVEVTARAAAGLGQ